MDDVAETGWGTPEHVWVVRHMRIDVVTPVLEDDRVELMTWCSGTAAVAAGRRLSLLGDRGGRVEVDSVWAHLGPDARPVRIGGFGEYAQAAGGRVVSSRLELPRPPANGERMRWPLRATDLDLLGHVNNAAYWQAVEQCLPGSGLDTRLPMRALLGYRHAIDLEEEVELVEFSDGGGLAVAFLVHDVVKAAARLAQIS
jgi:acyl-ACP thioesterase